MLKGSRIKQMRRTFVSNGSYTYKRPAAADINHHVHVNGEKLMEKGFFKLPNDLRDIRQNTTAE